MRIAKKNGGISAIKKYWIVYIMAALVLAFYFLFCYAPMYGILTAFKDYKPLLGVMDSKWVGWENFRLVFSHDLFWQALKNTLIISLLRLTICFAVPIILALFINEMRVNKIRSVFQTAIYLPHFISWVVIGGLVTMFLSPSTGLINKIIELFGGEPKYFLMLESSFLPIIILTDIWKNAGWGTIVYLAAIAGVNTELYEAARIDGAGKLKQTFVVTLPAMMPIISMMLILAVANILNAGFDQVLVFQNNFNGTLSRILDTYIYDLGIKGPYKGEATAIGLLKSIVALILLLGADRISKAMGQKGIV